MSYNDPMDSTLDTENGSAGGSAAGVGAVVCAGGDPDRARALSERLGVPLRTSSEARSPFLVVRPSGLALLADGMEMTADLSREGKRLRQRNLSHELLVKAAKIKRPAPGGRDAAAGRAPRAVDATAGLGADSLLLAAAGFDVDLYERDPVIAALLEDALVRGRRSADPLVAAAAGRMHLAGSDSVRALPGLGYRPDVVYLDPMFPERRKSAAVKKKFQLLHVLEAPATDDEALLEAALAARPRKVIIKRPLKGPCVGGAKPSYAVKGKAIRYDVIVPA